MKFFDAFAGIGGFSLGIHRAFKATQEQLWQVDTQIVRIGQNHSANEGYSRLDNSATGMVKHFIDSDDRQPTCVGYSEIDKYANSVYQRHFGEHKSYGDITNISTAELPDFDLLVGGFPCQSFSVAGKRAGFEDTRGTLFFELARILADKRPGYFCFENVKGLLSHDHGRTFKTIIATLDDLGYDLQWQVLNSKNFGVPQNRERVFIIGNLRDRPRPEVFPFGDSNGLSDQEQSQLAYAVTSTDHKGLSKQQMNGVQVGTWRTHKDGRGFREVAEGVSPTIPARAREDGSGQPVIIVKNHFNFQKKDIFTTIDASYYKGFDNHQQRSGIYNGISIRRLTPLECEKLQGFPANFTKFGKNGEIISDAQRYKMCGNAISVPVVGALFTRFFDSLGRCHGIHRDC